MSGEAFAIERLRENPELDFAELQRAAEESGIVIQPIQWGRARRQLGLTDVVQSEAIAPKVDAPQAEAPPQPEASTAVIPQPEQPAKPVRGFDFLVDALREEPTLSYGELKARADERQLKIAPIMYGRAKALLGLVPVRPRGQGKNRKPAPTALKQTSSIDDSSLGKQLDDARSVDELVKIVKQLDGERRRLRSLLETIANSIDEALGYDD